MRLILTWADSAHPRTDITSMYAEYDAPLSQTMDEFLDGPVLLELDAPAVANRTAEPFFAGQAAFLASLDGTNLPQPGTISSSSSAAPSSTSSRASTSRAATAKPVAPPKDKVEGGIIAGAVAGACGLAIIVAILFFCARNKGYCGGQSRTRENIYGETALVKDGEMRYTDKHASYSSEAALLGTPLGKIDSRYSSAYISDSDLSSSRYPSVSSFKLPSSPLGTPLYQDETPPMSPRYSGTLPPGAGGRGTPRNSYFPPMAGSPMTPPPHATTSAGSATYQAVPQQVMSPE